MKKLAFIVVNILVFSSLVLAAKPPIEVIRAFDVRFAAATNVKWGMENSKEWEAEFTVNGVKMSANFLTTGDWVETETQIATSQIPDAVIASIKKLHPKGVITGAYKIESAINPIKYEADIKTGRKKTEVILMEDGSAAH